MTGSNNPSNQLKIEPLKLLTINLSTFIVFQLIILYSLMLLSLFRGIVVEFFKAQANVNILVQDNLSKIFKSPSSLIILIIFILIELFFLLFALIGYYKIYGYSIKGEKVKTRTIIKESIYAYLILYTPKRIAILPIIVFTMIFSFLTMYPSTTQNLQIPDFILDWINQNKISMVSYWVFRSLMTVVWVFSLFITTSMLIYDKSFKEALTKNSELIKRNRFKYVLFVILLGAFIPLLNTAIYFISMLLVYSVGLILPNLTADAFFKTNWRANIFIPIIADIIKTGIVVTAYCTFHRIPVEYSSENLKSGNNKKALFVKKFVKSAVPLFIMILLIESYYSYYSPNIVFMDNQTKPSIVAHRAGATFASENSVEALKKARDSKIATAVEIDVQLTKDKNVILNHDPTLKRMTGNSKKASEMNLSEIKKLKLVHPLKKKRESNVPTLDEFLDNAKNIQVMIELKPDGNNGEELLSRVLEIVKNKNYSEKSIISSSNRKLLKLSKQKEPKVKTALITVVLLGAEFSEKYIDIFSIEAKGLSPNLVEIAHQSKKKLYVWTINSVKQSKKVLKSRPDGLLTDNVYLVDYAMNTVEDNILFQNEIFLFFLDKLDTQSEKSS